MGRTEPPVARTAGAQTLDSERRAEMPDGGNRDAASLVRSTPARAEYRGGDLVEFPALPAFGQSGAALGRDRS